MIYIKYLDENNNILVLNTADFTIGGVQNLKIERETLPLTEAFKQHHKGNPTPNGGHFSPFSCSYTKIYVFSG